MLFFLQKCDLLCRWKHTKLLLTIYVLIDQPYVQLCFWHSPAFSHGFVRYGLVWLFYVTPFFWTITFIYSYLISDLFHLFVSFFFIYKQSRFNKCYGFRCTSVVRFVLLNILYERFNLCSQFFKTKQKILRNFKTERKEKNQHYGNSISDDNISYG